MKPYRVEIGERYADDSAWERLVVLDTQTNDLRIRMNGSEANFDADKLDWLIEALQEAKRLTAITPA